MLPDYPKLKARITERYRDRLRAVINAHLGVFGEVPVTKMQEGWRSILHREDGSTGEMQPKRVEASAALTVDPKRVEELKPAQIIDMLDELGRGLAREKFKLFIQSIDEAVEKVGNVTSPDKKGVEAIFEALEKQWRDFNDDGTPRPTSLLFGSAETRQRVEGLFRQIMESPDLRKRYDSIVEKKREAWRDRETARNLVE
jgi:hypothetical protein